MRNKRIQGFARFNEKEEPRQLDCFRALSSFNMVFPDKDFNELYRLEVNPDNLSFTLKLPNGEVIRDTSKGFATKKKFYEKFNSGKLYPWMAKIMSAAELYKGGDPSIWKIFCEAEQNNVLRFDFRGKEKYSIRLSPADLSYQLFLPDGLVLNGNVQTLIRDRKQFRQWEDGAFYTWLLDIMFSLAQEDEGGSLSGAQMSEFEAAHLGPLQTNTFTTRRGEVYTLTYSLQRDLIILHYPARVVSSNAAEFFAQNADMLTVENGSLANWASSVLRKEGLKVKPKQIKTGEVNNWRREQVWKKKPLAELLSDEKGKILPNPFWLVRPRSVSL